MGSEMCIRDRFSALTIPSHAARYVAPIALALIWQRRQISQWFVGNIELILRVAIGMTFIGHGVKCLLHSGKMVTLIQAFSSSLGMEVAVSSIHGLLDVIGIVDILVASWIIISPSVFHALYMAFWAFVAANSRLFIDGLSSFDEVIILSLIHI